MEATQRIDSLDDDSDNESEDKNSQVQYGILRIVSDEMVNPGGLREFKVFGGETMIGRDPDQCNIVIDNKTLSRVHAILDIDDITSMTIHDNHSLNKTLRNGVQLKPDVHYAIEGGETITLGEIEMKFELVMRDETAGETPGTSTTVLENASQIEFQKVEGSCLVPETPAKFSKDFKELIIPRSPVETNGTDAHDRLTIPDSPESHSTSRMENDSLNDSSFLAPSQPVFPRHVKDCSGMEKRSERSVGVSVNSHIFEMETQQVGNIYDLDTQIVDEPVIVSSKIDRAVPDTESADMGSSPGSKIVCNVQEKLIEVATTINEIQQQKKEEEISDEDVTGKESEEKLDRLNCEKDHFTDGTNAKEIVNGGTRVDSKQMEDDDLFLAETQPCFDEDEQECEKSRTTVKSDIDDLELNTSVSSENLLDGSMSAANSPRHSSPIPIASTPKEEEQTDNFSEAPTQLLNESNDVNGVESDEIIVKSQNSSVAHASETDISTQMAEPVSNCSFNKMQMSNNVQEDVLADAVNNLGDVNQFSSETVTSEEESRDTLTNLETGKTVAKTVDKEELVWSEYIGFKKKIVRRSKEEQKERNAFNASTDSSITRINTVMESPSLDSEGNHSDQEQASEPLILPSTQRLVDEKIITADSERGEFEEIKVEQVPEVLGDSEVSSGDEAKLVIDESSDRPIKSFKMARNNSSVKKAEKPTEKQSRRQQKSNHKITVSPKLAIKVEEKLGKVSPQSFKKSMVLNKSDNIVSFDITCASSITEVKGNVTSEFNSDQIPIGSGQIVKLADGTDVRRSSRQVKRSSRLLETYDTSPSKPRKLTPAKKLMQNVDHASKIKKNLGTKRVSAKKSRLEKQERTIATANVTYSSEVTNISVVSVDALPEAAIDKTVTNISTSNLDKHFVEKTVAAEKEENSHYFEISEGYEQQGYSGVHDSVERNVMLPRKSKKSAKSLKKERITHANTGIQLAIGQPLGVNSAIDESGSEEGTRPLSVNFPAVTKGLSNTFKPDTNSRKHRRNVSQSPKDSSQNMSETCMSPNSTSVKDEILESSVDNRISKNSPTKKSSTIGLADDRKVIAGKKETFVVPRQRTERKLSESPAINELETLKLPSATVESETQFEKRSRKRKPNEANIVSPEPSHFAVNRRKRGTSEPSVDSPKKNSRKAPVRNYEEKLNSKKIGIETGELPSNGADETKFYANKPSKSDQGSRESSKRQTRQKIGNIVHSFNAVVAESPPKKTKKSNNEISKKKVSSKDENIEGTKEITASPGSRNMRSKRNARAANVNSTTIHVEPKEQNQTSVKTSNRSAMESEFVSTGDLKKPKIPRQPVNVGAESDETVPLAQRRKRRGAGDSIALIEIPSRRSNVRKESTASLDSSVSSTVSSSSSGRRKVQQPSVMFTGMDNQQDKKIVRDLGGLVTEILEECTVLVTDKIRRTAKFLCMVGKGVPIVTPAWLKMSKETKCFQDPWLHIIIDEESEKKWGFNLRTTLRNSGKSPLLSNLKVFATNSVMPSLEQFKEMVEFAGGEWLTSLPRKPSDNVIVISCIEDKKLLTAAIKNGVKIFDKELLLTGLLKRELDRKSHLLHL